MVGYTGGYIGGYMVGYTGGRGRDMQIDEVAHLLSHLPQPTFQKDTLTSLMWGWKDCTFAYCVGETVGAVLTKKEPCEPTYGVTVLSFTGLKKDNTEPFVRFLVERLGELLG